MTQRRFRTQLVVAAALMLLGCTQLKPVPATVTPPAPTQPGSEDEVAPPAPGETATPTPTPSPSASPEAVAPKVSLTSPVATTDFSATSVDVVFAVEPGPGRKVVDARITYDGKVLATFNQNALTYRLDKWNPQVTSSSDATPVRFGDHTLAVSVKDDAGQEGKAELKFYKPLRMGAWKEATSLPGPLAHALAFNDAAFPPAYMVPWGVATEPLEPPTAAATAYNFNPAGDGSWTTVALTGDSVPRAAYGAAVHPGGPGKVYLVGGRTGTQDLRSVELFSPLAKQAVKSLAVLTNARMKPAVAILDDHLYVIGGMRGAVALNSVERVKLDATGDPSGNFEARADVPTARVGAHAVVVGKEIWLIGGGFKQIEAYDPAKNEWKALTNAAGATLGTPETWSDALMIPVNNRYYFFGGTKVDGQAVNRIHELDPAAKTWRDLGELPKVTGVADVDRPETAMAGCYENGHFYLMGGISLPEQKLTRKVFKGEAL